MPDGNDVVFRALADFARLHRDIQSAEKDIVKLRATAARDIVVKVKTDTDVNRFGDQLRRSLGRDPIRVPVHADTGSPSDPRGFRQTLQRELRQLQSNDATKIKIPVDADTQRFVTSVKAAVAAARRSGNVKVKLDIDTTDFRTKLRDALDKATTPALKAKVGFDVGSRTALRRAIKDAVDAASRPTLKVPLVIDVVNAGIRRDLRDAIRAASTPPLTVKIKLDIDATGLRERIRLAIQRASAGQQANIPINTGGGLGGLGGGGGGGGGSLISSGLVTALAAAFIVLTQALYGAVAGAVAFVSALAPLAGLIGVLPLAIAGAAASVGVLFLAFSPVIKAMQAYTAADEDATKSSQQAGQAAQQKADALRSAEQGVTQAEQSLANAQIESRRAQEDLNQARVEARRTLEDLQAAVDRASLDERKARLDVREAFIELQKVQRDPTASQEAREEAQISYEEAKFQLADILRTNKRNAEDLKQLRAKGIEGSDQVVAAQDRIRSSAQAVGNAQTQLQNAQRQLSETQAQSFGQAAAAQDKLSAALSKLSPQATKFVSWLKDAKAQLSGIGVVAQEGVFSGINDGLAKSARLWPVVRRGVQELALSLGDVVRQGLSLITSGPWTRDFGTVVHGLSGLLHDVGTSLFRIIDGLRNVVVSVIPLARFLASLITQFSTWFQSITRVNRANGEMAAFFELVRRTVAEVITILKNLVGGLYEVGKVGAVQGRKLLGTLVNLTAQFRAWTKSVQGQKTLRDFFNFGVVVFTILGSLIGYLVKALQAAAVEFGKLAAWENAHGRPLTQFFTDIARVISVLVLTALRALIDNVERFGLWYQQHRLEILEFWDKLHDKISGIDPSTLLQVLGALAALSFVGPKVFGVISAVTSAVTGLVATIGGLSAATVGIAALVAGLVAGFVVAVRDSESLRNALTTLGRAFERFGVQVGPELANTLKVIVDAFERFWRETAPDVIHALANIVRGVSLFVVGALRLVAIVAPVAGALLAAFGPPIATALYIVSGVLHLIAAALIAVDKTLAPVTRNAIVLAGIKWTVMVLAFRALLSSLISIVPLLISLAGNPFVIAILAIGGLAIALQHVAHSGQSATDSVNKLNKSLVDAPIDDVSRKLNNLDLISQKLTAHNSSLFRTTGRDLSQFLRNTESAADQLGTTRDEAAKLAAQLNIPLVSQRNIELFKTASIQLNNLGATYHKSTGEIIDFAKEHNLSWNKEGDAAAIGDAMRRENENLNVLAQRYGLTEQQVKDFADAHKIDLTNSLKTVEEQFERSGAKIKTYAQRLREAQIQVQQTMGEASRVSGITLPELKTTDSAGKTTRASILKGFADRLESVRRMRDNIRTLIRKGLPASAIQQLYEGGPEVLDEAVKLSPADLNTIKSESLAATQQTLAAGSELSVAQGKQAGRDYINALVNQAKLGAPLATKALADIVHDMSQQARVQAGLGGGQVSQSWFEGLTVGQQDNFLKIVNTFPPAVKEGILQSVGLGRIGGSDTGTAYWKGLDSQSQTILNTMLALLPGNMRTPIQQLLGLAKGGGKDTATNYILGLTDEQQRILGAMIATLPDPLRKQIESMLGIAETGGGNTAQKIANGISSKKKEVTDATRGVADAVQREVDKIHGKSIDVTAKGKFDGSEIEKAAQAMGMAITDPKLLAVLKGVQSLKGKFATGGMLHGPGTGTSDDIPIMASAGEYVVNAKATRKWLPLLNHLNWNDAPAFSSGGMPGRKRKYAAGDIIQAADENLTASAAQPLVNRQAASLAILRNLQGLDLATSGFSGPLGPAPAATGPLQQYAKTLLNQYGWPEQWAAFSTLVMHESGWDVHATNPSSGAYGIPQALPPGKMASAGSDWRTSGYTQLRWMMQYIKERYGSPARAWAQYYNHPGGVGWYAKGGPVLPMVGRVFGANDRRREQDQSGNSIKKPKLWTGGFLPYGMNSYAAGGPTKPARSVLNERWWNANTINNANHAISNAKANFRAWPSMHAAGWDTIASNKIKVLQTLLNGYSANNNISATEHASLDFRRKELAGFTSRFLHDLTPAQIATLEQQNQNSTNQQFENAVFQLADWGFPLTVKYLVDKGDPTQDATILQLARELAGDRGKASNMEAQLKTAATILTGDDLVNASAIIASLRNHAGAWGIREVATDTNLDPKDVHDLGAKIKQQVLALGPGRNTTFLSQMAAWDAGIPFAGGGFVSPAAMMFASGGYMQPTGVRDLASRVSVPAVQAPLAGSSPVPVQAVGDTMNRVGVQGDVNVNITNPAPAAAHSDIDRTVRKLQFVGAL